jgi:hypothetical protein
MGGAMIRSGRAWEREEISRGRRVVALGSWDAAARRLSGSVLLFGLGGDRDPMAALRKELLLRGWPIATLIIMAALALLLSLMR